MALSGRIRSALPLFGRILSAESPAGVGLRTFASQAKSVEANVKVPLSLFGGLGNYASALFLAASKANALDKVESEILEVVVVSKKNPLFSQFIEDLSVPQETRVKAVKELFCEAVFSDVTKNFLDTLGNVSYTPESQIDPIILGGSVVEFEQKVFVVSTKTRAKQMEKFLKATDQFSRALMASKCQHLANIHCFTSPVCLLFQLRST
ncbi:ATP synthase [Musa troglodytarum]|uniref:ATP synthase n=1 Tax=Musa troglodytarum TaxID=320322 RepID=A0A9E7GG20_9LILI|nr:ATP synthase [Musa troglodytarum]